MSCIAHFTYDIIVCHIVNLILLNMYCFFSIMLYYQICIMSCYICLYVVFLVLFKGICIIEFVINQSFIYI